MVQGATPTPSLTEDCADFPAASRMEVQGTLSLLSAIVDSSEDAIVSKTLDGTITSWNRAAEKMFGYTEAEIVGQSIRLIIPADRQAEEDFVLARIRSGQKVDHFETIRETKDGRRLNISLTVSPIRDKNGTVIGASKIARDITSKIHAEQELLATRQRLSEALASRDQFFAVAAHELREPLNSLSFLLSYPEDSTDLKYRRCIEKSRRQLDRLSSLIDRLMDVAYIRAGTFNLDCHKMDLAMLVREVISRFTIEYPEIVISLECEPRIEGKWDRLRLDEVVTNLLSNAIKYGMKRPVAVSVIVEGDYAFLTVRDQGIGITANNLDRIFEAFEQADVSARKKGLGIGLWITKKIIEAHGGKVSVQSEINQGSTFIVQLPL